MSRSRAVPVLPTTLLALAATAAAQEAVDLAAAQAPRVGERVWVEERWRALERFDVLAGEDRVLYHHERVRGYEATYVEEVLVVRDGAAVDVRRRYATFVDLSADAARDVEGLVVRLRPGPDGGPPRVEVEAGRAPEALREALGDAGAARRGREALLPVRPVAPGESWGLDLEGLAAGLGLTAELDRAASRAQGTLTGRSRDERGRVWLEAAHDVRLVCERFQGMRCGVPPVVVAVEGGLRATPDGPGAEVWLEGTVQGRTRPPLAPEGVAVVLDGRLERREVRRSLE